MTDHTTKRRVETGNQGVSCPQHLRLSCPPLNPMECALSHVEASVGRGGVPGPWGRRVLWPSGVALAGRLGAVLCHPHPLQGAGDDGGHGVQPEASLALSRFRTPGITCTFMGPPCRGCMNAGADNAPEKSVPSTAIAMGLVSIVQEGP